MMFRAAMPAAVALFISLALGCVRGPGAADSPAPAAPAAAAGLKQNPALLANQWLQTSAEYEALCLQIYNDAAEELNQVAQGTPRDAEQRSLGISGKPLAVVMDLDETVLDNAAFQTAMLKSNGAFDWSGWTRFVNEDWAKVGLVPGAREFIEQAELLGVTPIYISNRNESERPGTVKSLANHKIKADDLGTSASPRLLLRSGAGNKDARRKQTGEQYEIVMFIGDNLGDMSGEFDKGPEMHTIDQRREAVRRNAGLLGRVWFVLPNPTYGEWEKFLNRESPGNDLRE